MSYLLASSFTPHIAFSELDTATAKLIRYCRLSLASACSLELGFGIILMVILQAKWKSDSCATYADYGTSDSLLCTIGTPLYALATFGLALLIIMGTLGLYAAYIVRRFFVSIYLSLSLALVMFLGLALTLVISMNQPFVPFGLCTMIPFVFSLLPIVFVVLLLRYKSVDKSSESHPTSSMLETVIDPMMMSQQQIVSNPLESSLTNLCDSLLFQRNSSINSSGTAATSYAPPPTNLGFMTTPPPALRPNVRNASFGSAPITMERQRKSDSGSAEDLL